MLDSDDLVRLTMRTVEISAPGRAGVVTHPDPTAGDDIVKVELRVVPICTEFKEYASGKTTNRLGHEAAGIVVDPGKSHRVSSGDRVVVMPQYGCGTCAYCTSGDHIFCRNQRDVLSETGSPAGTATFADYIIKPDWLLLPVPTDVSLRHAAMACCALGPSFNATQTMRVSFEDTLLVIGCGPVGLGAVINGVARGAHVIAVEVNPYRALLAEQLGASVVFDGNEPRFKEQIAGLTSGRGVDAVFDTTGDEAALELMEEVVGIRARVCFVVFRPVKLHRVTGKGLEIHGCWHWNHQRDALEMFALIRRSMGALDTLITHSFALEEVNDAFEVQLSGRCGKVLLLPFGERDV